IRTTLWLKSTKMGQLFSSWLERSGKADQDQDMAYFRRRCLGADDPRADRTRQLFRLNLEEICKIATAHGSKVLLSTVAVNLKDCPPLGSLHRPDLSAIERTDWQRAFDLGVQAEKEGDYQAALGRYLEAAKIDDHFAELHFRIARCQLATRDRAEAKKH